MHKSQNRLHRTIRNRTIRDAIFGQNTLVNSNETKIYPKQTADRHENTKQEKRLKKLSSTHYWIRFKE